MCTRVWPRGRGRLAPVALDDLELWRAWRDGDAAAGNALVERHFASIYRFFRGKVAPHADELTQQTFLACVEAKTRFRDGNSFRSYLFGIARNKLLHHFEGRGKSVRAGALSHMSIMDLAPSPSGVVAELEDRARLLSALQCLPVDHQIVIELVYWEHMPLREVAEVVGAPEGTIKSRLHRARAQLHEELSRQQPNATLDFEAATERLARSLAPPPRRLDG